MDFIEKVKGFLLEPSKTFDALKEESLEEATKYYAVLAAVYSALLALLLTFAGNLIGPMMGFGNMGMIKGAGAGIGSAIIIFVVFMIILIAGAFIGGAITHIFVYIVGGRRGIAQTIKAGMYGSTPSLLFGWIPVIEFIAMIWSLVAEIIGIRQLHELTTGKAISVVILMIITAIILTIVLAAVIAILFFLSPDFRI
ncbi:MAG: YIP1 family protein [Candidatus Methanoperedens sp.]|nr:YIP1 family protein [Candidatus Methanoperedens sp.]HLB71654.1 YIP1 family protein [Candidatus Methanoperedens sp.]